MPALTITNNKHGTYALVRVADVGQWQRLSPSQVTRIRHALCNRPDCACQGETLCQTGPQAVEITRDEKGVWVYASINWPAVVTGAVAGP